jgi:hypothetical protein
MIRVLVALMFAELVVVILLVDYRLDAVEATASRAAAPIPRAHFPSERGGDGTRDTAHLAEGAERVRTDETTPAPPPWGALAEADRQAVIGELYRAERVWRRTAGVLEGVSSLQKREAVRGLDRAERTRIAEITRDYAGRRVGLELAVMASDLPDMDSLRAELGGFDTREADRIAKELSSFLDPASAAHVTRLIVPRAP